VIAGYDVKYASMGFAHFFVVKSETISIMSHFVCFAATLYFKSNSGFIDHFTWMTGTATHSGCVRPATSCCHAVALYTILRRAATSVTGGCIA